MTNTGAQPGVAIVTAAAGQDGYFLTQQLLRAGWVVHTTSRQLEKLEFENLTPEETTRLHRHEIDLLRPQTIFELIASVRPDEFYNLAGQSSVSRSFSEPLYTWQTNAEAVVHLLECIRRTSPATRFYQASSTEMFGISVAASGSFNETSPLNPQSPYASAKAAAHLLCRSYREVYGLKIACGILSNHESHRRPASFLTRKVVDHVIRLTHLPPRERRKVKPLVMGNLKIRRDWGFAPDYVAGMSLVLRQVQIRSARHDSAARDEGANYHDYLLATGESHAVWEFVDCAFQRGGFKLNWELNGDEPTNWLATFEDTGETAVVVSADLLRVAEPPVIEVDPSRAVAELGWAPQRGLEVIVKDMFEHTALRAESGTLAAL